MTLNLTLLTERTIYQSSDYRLTDYDTGQVEDKSTKLVSLLFKSWHGMVSYTGIGRWEQRDTSDRIVEWLTGLADLTVSQVLERIREKGDEWLSRYEANVGKRRRHTFVLAAYEGNTRPLVATVSNFEDCFKEIWKRNPSPCLFISTMPFNGRPTLTVTGMKDSVHGGAKWRLFEELRKAPDNPARTRGMLTAINAAAAATPEAGKAISPACSVFSFRSDGQGQGAVDGMVEMHAMMQGFPLPGREELIRMLGFEIGFLRGSAVARTGPRLGYAPCQPEIVKPPASVAYELKEFADSRFGTCSARAVNDGSIIVGNGSYVGQPGTSFAWIVHADGKAEITNYKIRANAINSFGVIAIDGQTDDGTNHAGRWSGRVPEEVDDPPGCDSSARAINSAGTLVGWAGMDPKNKGQASQRAAVWRHQKGSLLEAPEFSWSNAVAVTERDEVLVVAFKSGLEPTPLLWLASDNRVSVVGGSSGVYPVAINAKGDILGKANGPAGEPIGCIAEPGNGWKMLGTERGFYATGMNDHGDIVGAISRDGFRRPLLWRPNSEIVWLPYYDYHHCLPLAVNNHGLVVGEAGADHGAHALIWVPPNLQEQFCLIQPVLSH
jgi:hypothetical protein